MSGIINAKTPAELTAAYKELFTGDPTKIYVHCGEHMYFPGKLGIENVGVNPPVNTDCKSCWDAYFLVYFAKLPPEMRAQRLDELERVLRKAAESERAGTFDYRPFRHPEISIERS